MKGNKKVLDVGSGSTGKECVYAVILACYEADSYGVVPVALDNPKEVFMNTKELSPQDLCVYPEGVAPSDVRAW